MYIKLTIAAIIRSIEAVACVRKYFVAASVDRELCCLVNRGIMANMFISNPTQIRNQCELVITSSVPNIIVIMIKEKTMGLISAGRVMTNIFGVWAR